MGKWGRIGYELNHYSEADMELCLSNNLDLIARDFGTDELELIGRQVDVGVGKIDILARTKEGRLVVIELKRNTIDCNAVGQIMRYISAIEDVLHSSMMDELDGFGLHFNDSWDIAMRARDLPKGSVSGCLVAPSIESDASGLIRCLEKSYELHFVPMKLLMVPALIDYSLLQLTEEERQKTRLKRESQRSKIAEFIEVPKDELRAMVEQMVQERSA